MNDLRFKTVEKGWAQRAWGLTLWVLSRQVPSVPAMLGR